jgi:hypothetical protein
VHILLAFSSCVTFGCKANLLLMHSNVMSFHLVFVIDFIQKVRNQQGDDRRGKPSHGHAHGGGDHAHAHGSSSSSSSHGRTSSATDDKVVDRFIKRFKWNK